MRYGRNPSNLWEARLAADYGYIRRTHGNDGDQVDCFIGPQLDSEQVFIFNQLKADGSFDEHKVMLGFPNEISAGQAYGASYTPGHVPRFAGCWLVPMSKFKTWLQTGDHTKPFE